MATSIGPNVKRLIAHKMSLDAIPPGGGFAAGLDYLLSPDLGKRAGEAAQWVRQAIDLVKTAPGGDARGDDEAIAGELLRQIEDRRASRGGK